MTTYEVCKPLGELVLEVVIHDEDMSKADIARKVAAAIITSLPIPDLHRLTHQRVFHLRSLQSPQRFFLIHLFNMAGTIHRFTAEEIIDPSEVS